MCAYAAVPDWQREPRTGNEQMYVMVPVRQEDLRLGYARIDDSAVVVPEEMREQLIELIAENQTRSEPKRKLQMTLFHQVSLAKEAEIGKPFTWRTSKVQQLFLYLVQHRGKIVDKSTLIDMLWPEYDPQKAYSQLYTAVYHIRRTLRPYEEHFSIRSISEGYMLELSHVELDVEQFEQTVMECRNLTVENVGRLEAVMELYKGEYLSTFDYIWAEEERRRLFYLWYRTADQLIKWYESKREWGQALRLALQLCDSSPLDETAYLKVMQLYDKIGQRAFVRATYKRLVQVLDFELQMTPGEEVEVWYRTWEMMNQ
ncbi:AfsR/SARP family transcriptional regulator [Alkalicoccus urumqiensis]|uniref:OmpR/PhoB-type domain-containing protein n=1 Tax=Alkalicoccus urumqiensis TaxID=1548213 RepID=A0A2P6MIM6_ALKUR|nr:BTAD domain-containing putative transcriptional regulator [Alkalicoccus urumqiensis]PRO66154.1 hypothetical protein C6I21_04960 [Alkalicoccus urumqiensis]